MSYKAGKVKELKSSGKKHAKVGLGGGRSPIDKAAKVRVSKDMGQYAAASVGNKPAHVAKQAGRSPAGDMPKK